MVQSTDIWRRALNMKTSISRMITYQGLYSFMFRFAAVFHVHVDYNSIQLYNINRSLMCIHANDYLGTNRCSLSTKKKQRFLIHCSLPRYLQCPLPQHSALCQDYFLLCHPKRKNMPFNDTYQYLNTLE